MSKTAKKLQQAAQKNKQIWKTALKMKEQLKKKLVKERERGCKRKCKCIDKVSHEKREIIYKQYCAIKKKLQKEFLFQRIKSFPKKRSRIRTSPKKKRNNSRIYSLKVNGKVIAVCSKSFLGTLSYKKDNVISALFNKQTPTKSRLSASDFPDMRGKQAPILKMSE